MSTSTTLIDKIPLDILHMILRLVTELDNPRWPNPKELKDPIYELSQVNKTLRQLCTPLIFGHGCISWWGSGKQLNDNLVAIVQNRPLANTFQALRFRLTSIDQPDSPISGLDMISGLQAMKSLKELQVDIGSKSTPLPQLRSAFKDSAPKFLPIDTLIIDHAQNLDFLVRACPNLQNLVLTFGTGIKQNLRAATTLQSLNYLEIKNQKLKVDDIEVISSIIPGIKELCFKGELHKTKASDFAPRFARLTHLEKLGFTTTQWINTVWLRQHYFDDRFLDAIDDRQEHHVLNENDLDVAKAFCTHCPTLKSIHLLFAYETKAAYKTVRDGAGVVVDLERMVRVGAGEENHWYGKPTTIEHY